MFIEIDTIANKKNIVFCPSIKPVLGQTSEWTTSEWTNVRVDNVRVTNIREDKTSEKTKRQRRQTSEWDKRQRNFDFYQTLTFYLKFKKDFNSIVLFDKDSFKKDLWSTGTFFFFFFLLFKGKILSYRHFFKS